MNTYADFWQHVWEECLWWSGGGLSREFWEMQLERRLQEWRDWFGPEGMW